MILCEFLYTLPYAVREESLGKTNPSLKFGSCCFTIVLQIEQILLAFQQSRSCKQTYLSWVYSEMDEYLLLNLYKYNIFVLVGVFGKRNICCIIPYSNRYEVTPYMFLSPQCWQTPHCMMNYHKLIMMMMMMTYMNMYMYIMMTYVYVYKMKCVCVTKNDHFFGAMCRSLFLTFIQPAREARRLEGPAPWER